MNKLNKIVSSIAIRLFLIDFLKCSFVAFAGYFFILFLFKNHIIACIAGTLLFATLGILLKLWKNKKNAAKEFVHQYNPKLEHSLSLVEKTNLNLIEQMQLERIQETKVDLPLKLDKTIWIMFFAALLSLGLRFIPSRISTLATDGGNIFTKKTTPDERVIPKFKSAQLEIIPPKYTGLSTRISSDLNATVVAGSVLKWEISFENTKNVKVYLENAKGKSIEFNKKTDVYYHQDQILHSGFYSIKAFEKDSMIYQSAFYRIESIPDTSPKIEPTSKKLYSFHQIKDPKTINITAKISDDFSISQAFIVATVARGSGENVKFREVKWPVGGKNLKSSIISKTIDLNALKFSPGDELYYYWAAFDNKQPEPNFSKSDTYFVVFKDTASKDESDLATMAMNILPEYFRSQRQIIIDTEKLIKKKSKIKREVFNSESNEIGYDQKVLRLRYGQYLGEEFENSIGAAPHGEEDGDFMKGFVHAHDTEEQEDNHPKPENHEHAHAAENPNTNQDPLAVMMAEYVHSHDDAETNTFYEQSTRSLLKMALEQMWQSELHLRLYEPEKALPFENKALTYLKEAQQKARVFVKKTGFDPPPIKEKEKRLTGELTKFNAQQNITKAFLEDETRLLAAAAIDILEKNKIDASDKQKLILLGQTLAELPAASGLIMKDIQAIINSKAINMQQRENLRNGLIQILNFVNQPNKGGKTLKNSKELQSAFRKHLK